MIGCVIRATADCRGSIGDSSGSRCTCGTLWETAVGFSGLNYSTQRSVSAASAVVRRDARPPLPLLLPLHAYTNTYMPTPIHTYIYAYTNTYMRTHACTCHISTPPLTYLCTQTITHTRTPRIRTHIRTQTRGDIKAETTATDCCLGLEFVLRVRMCVCVWKVQ